MEQSVTFILVRPSEGVGLVNAWLNKSGPATLCQQRPTQRMPTPRESGNRPFARLAFATGFHFDVCALNQALARGKRVTTSNHREFGQAGKGERRSVTSQAPPLLR